MSTKIFNGYVLSNMSAHEMNKFFEKVRSDVKQYHETRYREVFRGLMIYFIDGLNNGTDIKNLLKTYLREQENEIPDFLLTSQVYHIVHYIMITRDKHIKNSLDRDPLFDFTSNIQVIPMQDKILALTYFENEIGRIWEKYPEVSEYVYFDNTDKPDEINDEEWEQRGLEWSIAMPDGIPANYGFNVECSLNRMPMPTYEELQFDKVSHDSRAKKVAFNQLIRKYRATLPEEMTPYERGSMVERWTKTKEYEEQLQEEMKLVDIVPIEKETMFIKVE